jgi:predicted nucleic acid-binding protein
MLFLDSSTIIEYSEENPTVVEYLEDSGQLFTSAICVYEVVNGEMWATGESARAVRNGFGGVQSIELNEEIAMEAARIQTQLRRDGDEMAVRDLLIAATARSTGAELVVADSDFDVEHLRDMMTVTNLDTEAV